MFALPGRPQTVPELVANSFRLWKADFWRLLLLSFIAVVIGILPYFFIPQLDNSDLIGLLRFIEANYLWVLLYFIIVLYFYAAIIYRVFLISAGKSGGLFMSFTVASKRLPWLLAAALLGILSIAIGLGLAILPGIMMMILLLMYEPLVVIDGKGPIEAYRMSCELVWGNWWRTFAVVFLCALFFFTVVYIIELLSMDIWRIEYPEGTIWASYNLFRMGINSLFYPLFAAVLIVLKHDLQLRRASGLRLKHSS